MTNDILRHCIIVLKVPLIHNSTYEVHMALVDTGIDDGNPDSNPRVTEVIHLRSLDNLSSDVDLQTRGTHPIQSRDERKLRQGLDLGTGRFYRDGVNEPGFGLHFLDERQDCPSNLVAQPLAAPYVVPVRPEFNPDQDRVGCLRFP